MQRPLQFLAVPIALLFAMSMAGCTLFPEKQPATLATTTSAEQHERILWQMVEKQQWGKISPLLSPTLVWNVDGKSLSRDQVVAYLRSLQLTEAAVRDVSVQPNGPDMTVAYTLESTAGTSSKGCSGLKTALSVWQQVKGGGWVLIAHSDQGKGGACTAS